MRKERNLEEVGDGASARRLVKSFSTCLFSEQMSQVATTGARLIDTAIDILLYT